jgi:hypothetical protein
VRETETRPALASYRDRVTELMEAGEPFAVVEDAIDERSGVSEDAKAVLWLWAFSMLEVRGGNRVAGDRPRPLEFDARGFPIRQPIPSFVQRVARLLGEEQAR